MYNSRNVIAIVVAGGRGKRFSETLPKQFLDIGGKALIEYSLATFNDNPYIDEIIVVTNPLHTDRTKKICEKFSKISNVILGGETRSISSRNGVFSVKNTNSYILIHDSARPLVSNNLIKRLLDNVEETGAVIPCIPSPDSLIAVENSFGVQTLDRRNILRVQTPQCFKYEVIYTAYKATEELPIDYPDDSSIVIQKSLTKVKVIEGDIHNIKITTKEDAKIFLSLLNSKHNFT
ncbi:MAG: 2-C-methyl-D-erythritol 4-phosphate cytidylyltransferase [Brevinematia bacterium]